MERVPNLVGVVNKIKFQRFVASKINNEFLFTEIQLFPNHKN